jgi:hypothetical protein
MAEESKGIPIKKDDVGGRGVNLDNFKKKK